MPIHTTIDSRGPVSRRPFLDRRIDGRRCVRGHRRCSAVGSPDRIGVPVAYAQRGIAVVRRPQHTCTTYDPAGVMHAGFDVGASTAGP